MAGTRQRQIVTQAHVHRDIIVEIEPHLLDRLRSFSHHIRVKLPSAEDSIQNIGRVIHALPITIEILPVRTQIGLSEPKFPICPEA